MKRFLVATILLWTVAPATGFLNGAELQGICGQPGGPCLSYLMGVVDGANAMEWEKVVTGLCPPPKVTVEEIRRIFLDYIEFEVTSYLTKVLLGMIFVQLPWALDGLVTKRGQPVQKFYPHINGL
jgi:hypothetical protein